MLDGIKKPTKTQRLVRKKALPKHPASFPTTATERTKLWLIVGSLAIIIFIGWILSLKYTFKRQQGEERLSNLKNIQEDLSQAFLELKEQIDELKKVDLPISPTLTDEQIEEMSKKLKNIKTEESTSTEVMEDKQLNTENWLTYRNEEYGFEIKYPKDWFLYSDNPKNIRVQPEENEPGLTPGPASEAFEVNVLENTLGIDLDKWVKKDFGNIKYSTQIITISGIQGLKVDQQEEAIDPTPYIYLPKGNQIYLIKRNLGKFDTFYQILSTFKFLD